MSTRCRLRVRVATGCAIAAVALAVGACGRGARPASAPATPTPVDTARTTAARADTSPRAAQRDTTVRDTARVRGDTAARTTVERNRRRTATDPTSRCHTVNFNDSPPTSRLQSLTDANGKYITFVGGGVVAHCEGVNNTLRADSAEYYQASGMLILVNNVFYDEPRRASMTSQRLTYYTVDERIIAETNVIVTTPAGSRLAGPNVEYLRAVPRVREHTRLTAIGRPVLYIIQAASARPAARGDTARAGAPKTPRRGADTATVVANVIVNEADSLVFASGDVQILRPDVVANSDSATLDQGRETARLIRNARIQGTRGRPFTLTGSVVDLFSRERTLTRVLAKSDAKIVSQDLNLTSDTVDLRLDDGRVERAFAWGPKRATATSPERDVIADSIEAVMPQQRIRELYAVRNAIARSVPDSTRIKSTERDLLRGDTITARFDSVAAGRDTTKNPPVRVIVAAGNASSLFQVASSQGREARPSINYVRGRLITVNFDSGQVQTVTVTEKAAGVYLEVASDSTSRDSTAARRPRATRPATGAPAGRRGLPRPGRGPQPDAALAEPAADPSLPRRVGVQGGAR